MSKAIDEAFEREDEIETLPVEEQLQFWRNAAKVNQRLCRTLRVSKKLYCQTFMDEIRRLNEKVKGLDESCDIVDPLILKNNVKKLIAQQLKGNPTVEKSEEDKHEIDGEDNYGERDDVTMNEGVEEMGKNEERDEVIKDEEEEQMVEDEEGSNGERDDVSKNEVVVEMGKSEERDEVIKDEEDKQMVEDEEGSNIERDDVTKNEVVEEMGKSVERDEVIKDEEDKQMVQEEEGVVEKVPLSKGLKRPRKPVSKKYVGYRSRAPSKRATKKGKLVRTPFTEDKKPRAKGLKLKEGEHKDEPIVVGDTPKKITVYHDDSVGKWDVLKSTYLTDVDRAALKEVNEGIPDVGTFSLRVLDSAGAFVHNYRIPKNVAEKLSAEENKWLAQYCKEKCSPYVYVITTDNSTITYPELLYMIRGGRLDDKVTEAFLDRLRLWLQLQENADLNKQYGIVSTYFCHSLYGDQAHERLYELYELYIQQHIAAGRSILIFPIVRHDHWHCVEVRLNENLALHYSSVTPEAFLEPVNKIINFMDHMKVAFDIEKVCRTFQYKEIPCEPQKGSYDCGIYVYLYVRAILQKGDVLHVTPADDSSAVVRARIAAELIKEGWEFRNRKGKIAVEDPELKAPA